MTIYHTFILLVFLLLPWAAHAETGGSAVPAYDLHVTIDPANAKITGTAALSAEAGKEIILHTADLTIRAVTLDRRPHPYEIKDGHLRIRPAENGTVTIMYEGAFKGGPVARDTNAGVVPSVIGAEGVSLTGTWYPQPDYLTTYRLKTILPSGYQAVSEAETVTRKEAEGRTEFAFDFPHPVDGISLVASSRYEITKEDANGIELYAYFFPEDRELARTYLEYTKKYIALYEERIGKYPYKRFSVVENFLPTGYSMPTFTLLGSEVVRLPFIVETSLGHEILHQWFGNLVYIDYEKGNWAEGLTTYLADHFYEEQKGKGWEYRKQILLDYESYVNGKNEFALKDFRGRVDHASKAIGYGKTAMVFHMLRNLAGDDAFYAGLRDFVRDNRFRKASWEDIKKAFGKIERKDLDAFFSQWVDTPGLPDLTFDDFAVRINGSRVEVALDYRQGGKVYAFDIPLTIYYADGAGRKVPLRVDKADYKVTMSLDSMPVKIVIDEDYDTLRVLSHKETAPIIARLMGDERPVIAVSEAQRGIYSSLIDALKQRGAVEKGGAEVKDADLSASSVVIMGEDTALMGRLYGGTAASLLQEGGFSIAVKENPWNSHKVVGMVKATSKEEVDAAFRKIFHYGKYSALAFDKGKNIHKKIEDSQRGLKVWKREQTAAVDTAAISTLPGVIDRVVDKKIVYVGEYHDRFAHHAVQLDVIKGLYAKNKKIAIGMEMFQIPFQKVLDDYIAGTIDERTFLKKSEYFTRWRFDYNLYKPIIDFARAEKLPLIALNTSREIVEKVSRKGLDSLTEEEKKDVPQQMDFSDSDYRERLREVFLKHAGASEKKFDYFYQSQILWDETMAQSVDNFFRRNPDYQADGRMVVIAGGGHLSYGTGIPKRAFRRNGYSYSIILSDAEVEKEIADYILFPAAIEAAEAPKLMVMLDDTQKKVSIKGFSENSVAQQAGLKEDDVIISLDDVAVESVEDARIHLLYKKKGDTVRVKVIRKKFFTGDKVMEFEVVL